MKDNLTDITVILDRSGSMQSIASDAIGGLNRFVKDQQQLPGDANFTLVQFDTEYEVVHKTTPISEVGTLHLIPRGGTAILDAIGRTINQTGWRFCDTPESDRPSKVIMVIITDGQENSSKEYTRDRVFAMIKHQREAYKWEFNFLGANQDAISVGSAIGIAFANCMDFAANSVGIQGVFRAASRGVGSYRMGGSSEYLSSEREEQAKHGATPGGKV